jgi:uncharacterized protein (TIGR03437 family)
MYIGMRFLAVGRARSFFRFLLPVAVLGLFSLSATAQTSSNCNVTDAPTAVASAGLAEQIGDIVITCTGGTSGFTAIAGIYITLNTNITNSLDMNGNVQFITVNATGATVTESTPILTSATTLEIPNLTYTVPTPNSIPVTITISGIRAAVALVQNAQSGTVVEATLVAVGITLPNYTFPVAIGGAQLLASVQNNGVSCGGSPLPATTDFPTFISTGTASSAVRVTENSPMAFAPVSGNATNGTRILVQLSGYPAGTQLWVPNALVGNSGSVPTSAGEFASSIAGGTYTPMANQLLLSLVSGADQNGVGGTLLTALPNGGTSFTAMTQLTVTNGSAYAVYEVLDDSRYVEESVQVPVFIVNPATSCPGSAQPTISVMEAPVSTVSIPTMTDPIPRYVSAALAPDCQQTGDCNQTYFPVLSVSTTPISLTGASLGLTQSAPLVVLNNGGSLLTYTTSVSYQSGSGWLSVTPSTADVAAGLTVSVVADPSLLQAGTYTATLTINGGEAGSASVPVTFTVGPSGAAISGIVNAASFQVGAISPGSYVALFGNDLAGPNPTVTFNGVAANVIFDSAGQINLIVPASLSPQSGVGVVVMVNGQTSNTYTATLQANVLGIFTPGILNSDNSVNAASNPAKLGSNVQVYLTGLAVPVTQMVSVTLGSQTGIVPLYAGPQGTLSALDQVNVTIPVSLAFTGNSAALSVCISSLPGVPPICSNSVSLFVH